MSAVTALDPGRVAAALAGRVSSRLQLPVPDPAGPSSAPPEPAGLPAGALAVAEGYLAVAAAHAGVGGAAALGDRSTLAAATLLAPLVAAWAEGRPPPPRPVPRPVSAGAVAADLAGEQDRELFEWLLGTCGRRAEPERVAAAAQELRLPVLPYRRRVSGRADPSGSPRIARRGSVRRGAWSGAGDGLDGLVVCDLTGMWAGPLATALLARLGAEVVKVEMPGRPDGMRRWGGDNASPALFAALNRRKSVLRLDLRAAPDRARFERLVRRADVLVESHSRRVMPNLGYGEKELRLLQPSLILSSLRAFPPGPRGDWVAYGNGIHALSGLAAERGGGFVSPAVSYPDPLAGLLLFAVTLAQLRALARSGTVSTAEASLWGAIGPLRRGGAPGALGQTPDEQRLEPLRETLETL